MELSKTRKIIDKLRLAITKLNSFCDSFLSAQQLLRQLLREKNWSQTHRLLDDMRKTGDEIVAREEERIKLIEKFRRHAGMPESAKFTVKTLLMELPEEYTDDSREELLLLFGGLKNRLNRIRVNNSAISGYISRKNELVQHYINSLYPERKTYNNDGGLSGFENDSIIISKTV